MILATLLALQVATIIVKANSIKDLSQVGTLYSEAIADRADVPKALNSAEFPDIYYIVPDGYPSDDWLKKTLNYDNTEFTSALEDRGFIVTDHARSNYGVTYLSLASILNMRYVDENPSPLNDLDFLNFSIVNSEVSHILQDLGYTYIQFMSGFFAPSAQADVVRDFTPSGTIDVVVDYDHFTHSIMVDTGTHGLGGDIASHLFRRPFTPLYVDTTALRIFRLRVERLLGSVDNIPYDGFAGDRLTAAINEIDEIVSMPEATFTFIHFMKPHAPVTFNERGELIDADWQPTPSKYFSEFKYVNGEFLGLIDRIQQGSSTPPVIIFQADHGSTLGVVSNNEGRKILFDVYAAYSIPETFSVEFPNPYTLINSFPLILNELFATDIELLPDQLIESTYGAIFEQREVTEEFELN